MTTTLQSLLLAEKGKSLTSFFSLSYMIVVLPVTVFIYGILPKKWKKYFLLLASFGFVWLVSGGMLLYLMLTIFAVHYFGIWIERLQGELKATAGGLPKEERKALKAQYDKRKRGVVALGAVILIGGLLALKYSGFFTVNINTIFAKLGIGITLEIPSYVLPIGISFFTLQAISYIVDVYRGVIKADDNLFRLGLFISFFPQIVEGPICRYSQTAEQLWNVQPIRYKNLSFGAQRLLYGAVKKYIIADRLNLFVKNVFDMKVEYHGGVVAFAAICYTIQLYMDFSGAMDAVCGTAEIFGVKMPENFRQPFFSRTISEFWTRWHITLGTWFRDYIFYPVTSSKRMKKITSSARKKIGNHYGPLIAGSVALFCVWSCNGLWHGSAWSYIFFGMYHFVLILSGNLVEPLVKKIHTKLHINANSFPYRLFQIFKTVFLVIIGELFFRAKGLKAGFKLFKKMITDFSFSRSEFNIGIDMYDIVLVAVTLVIILVVSILHEKGISIREWLAKKPAVLRWAFLYGAILFIIIFGAYGYGYRPVEPMYAKF